MRGDAGLQEFSDNAMGRRQRPRARRAGRPAMLATAVVVIAMLGACAGPQTLTAPVTAPGSKSPPPKVSRISTAPPESAAFAVSTVTVGPGGTAWAILARCAGQSPVRCTPYLERLDATAASWRIVGALPAYEWESAESRILAPSARDLWVQPSPGSGLQVTHDGGATWHRSTTPLLVDVTTAGGALWGITCSRRTSCQILTAPGSGDRLVPTTTQPSLTLSPGGAVLARVAAVDATTAYVVPTGTPTYAVTTNGGRTWRTGRAPCTVGEGSVGVSRGRVLWWLCSSGGSAGNQLKTLFRSPNGGASWQHEPDPESTGYATNLTAVDATTAWRTGGRAAVFRTDDGGATWQAQLTRLFGDRAGGAAPEGFAAVGPDTALASSKDTVYRTADGGRTWQATRLAVPATPIHGLVPADAAGPAAGACGAAVGDLATIEINPDTPEPRCLRARPDQRLRVVNDTNRFGQHGRVLTVTFAGYPPRALRLGQATTYDQPLGDYLQRGVHLVHVSANENAELWLQP